MMVYTEWIFWKKHTHKHTSPASKTQQYRKPCNTPQPLLYICIYICIYYGVASSLPGSVCTYQVPVSQYGPSCKISDFEDFSSVHGQLYRIFPPRSHSSSGSSFGTTGLAFRLFGGARGKCTFTKLDSLLN